MIHGFFCTSSVLRFDVFFFFFPPRHSIEEVDYFCKLYKCIVRCVGMNLYASEGTDRCRRSWWLILPCSHFTCVHLFRHKQTNIIILFAILLMAIKFAMILKMYSKYPKSWNSPQLVPGINDWDIQMRSQHPCGNSEGNPQGEVGLWLWPKSSQFSDILTYPVLMSFDKCPFWGQSRQ